jgi:hypothetical protein
MVKLVASNKFIDYWLVASEFFFFFGGGWCSLVAVKVTATATGIPLEIYLWNPY